MADVAISGLTPASALTLADLFEIEQGTPPSNVSRHATLAQLRALIGGTGALRIFNVRDYGAVGDGVTDDTAPIQAAIDACALAGGGVVFFPVGVYLVAGELLEPSRSNAQLLLPKVNAATTKQLTIALVGEYSPPVVFSVVGDRPMPDAHSIIKTTLNAGAGGAVLGGWGPVGASADWTNIQVVMRDLHFALPPNPVLSGINLLKVSSADIDNVVVTAGGYYVQGLAEPTTASSWGIRMPPNNNGALSRMGTFNISGFYNGYEFAEHCNGFATQAAWGCKRAFVFASATNHALHFDRLMATHCQTPIVATGPSYVNIAQVNVEHATSGWRQTPYDIDDPSHYLRGSVGGWHAVLAGSGVSSVFTVNGAARLNVTRLGWENRLESIDFSADLTVGGLHANKKLTHPSSDTTARLLTIPSNAAMPFPIGTTLVVDNGNDAGVVTIAVTSDTLRQAGSGATGSRTLAANGMAVLVKVKATEWKIHGAGLT